MKWTNFYSDEAIFEGNSTAINKKINEPRLAELSEAKYEE
jgi:hypothetical protein